MNALILSCQTIYINFDKQLFKCVPKTLYKKRLLNYLATLNRLNQHPSTVWVCCRQRVVYSILKWIFCFCFFFMLVNNGAYTIRLKFMCTVFLFTKSIVICFVVHIYVSPIYICMYFELSGIPIFVTFKSEFHSTWVDVTFWRKLYFSK